MTEGTNDAVAVDWDRLPMRPSCKAALDFGEGLDNQFADGIREPEHHSTSCRYKQERVNVFQP